IGFLFVGEQNTNMAVGRWKLTPEARFLSKVETTETCWKWKAWVNDEGYGLFYFRGQMRPAHRVSHELFIGPIPDRYEVDHLCRNPSCVRPDHLEAVTPRQNFERSDAPASVNLRKTHCNWGHELSGANIHSYRGKRLCVECRRLRPRWRPTA